MSHIEQNKLLSDLEYDINKITNSNYGHIILKYNLVESSNKAQTCFVSPLYTSLALEKEGNSATFKNEINAIRSFFRGYNGKKLIHNASHKAAKTIIQLREFAKLSPAKFKNPYASNRANLSLQNSFTVLDNEGFSDYGLDTTDVLDELKYLEEITGMMPSIGPLKAYKVTSNFGKRNDPLYKKQKMHLGIDIKSLGDKRIYNTAPGIVRHARYDKGYGNFVEIDHGGGFSTRYAHLDEIKVHPGQHYNLGKIIGIQGNTGRSTNSHLHYEIRYKNKPLDPGKFLKFISSCSLE